MRAAQSILLSAAVLLAGCAGPRFTPQQAAPIAFKSLGPGAELAWIPSASNAISSSMAGAFLPASSPLVTSLLRAMSPGSSRPTSVAVSGQDSAFTAQVIKTAFAATPGGLPYLKLLFIGDQAQADEVRRAAESRGAQFSFEAMPR